MEDRCLAVLGISSLDGFNQPRVAGAIADLSTAAEARIEIYLDQIDLIEASLIAERESTSGPYQQLRGEARRFARRIAVELQVAIAEDIW